MWTALPEEAPALLDEALPLVRRAVELDPESAQANSLLGTILYAQLDWIGGEEAHAVALSLLSDRPALTQHALLLMRSGRSAAARTQFDAAESAEPMGGRPEPLRVHASLAQGRFAEAREIAGRNPQAPRALQTSLDLALNEGVPEEIKTRLSAMLAANNSSTALYSRVLSEFDSPELVLSTLRAAYADGSIQWASKRHDIAMLAAYFSDPEFALQVKAEEARNTPIRLFALWYPVMSVARQLPEFKELVTDINLVAYWRAYGWADACRPLGDDDFTCS
jgi:tetratricopeptide (TPR) repeat protein